tara:strand:- start:2861 stop:3154 length:294 start_codon:yes stop_codon:yes gene_type:complete
MNRYQNTPFLTGPNNVKYPEIPRDPSDIYVYTGRGDRYDTLATQYYNDSSLWWIIPIANSNQTPDSLIPNIGSQLRIPNNERIPNIIASYNSINMVS